MTLDEVHERLATALRGPLPGHAAFLSRSGYSRADLDSAQRADTAPRESAVLALLYPAMGEPHLLLMRRPEYAGVHSGQVSFPGGRREPQDADLQATALREFHEEIGATPKDLRVLGALSQVYIPPSRSLVTPLRGPCMGAGPHPPRPAGGAGPAGGAAGRAAAARCHPAAPAAHPGARPRGGDPLLRPGRPGGVGGHGHDAGRTTRAAPRLRSRRAPAGIARWGGSRPCPRCARA
ncbi:MAG: CoA pyrophosphatase [Flavobacteriales bacterium]|nr:CoA pyrophosphatase [Flavobacteriales bacterium]